MYTHTRSKPWWLPRNQWDERDSIPPPLPVLAQASHTAHTHTLLWDHTQSPSVRPVTLYSIHPRNHPHGDRKRLNQQQTCSHSHQATVNCGRPLLVTLTPSHRAHLTLMSGRDPILHLDPHNTLWRQHMIALGVMWTHYIRVGRIQLLRHWLLDKPRIQESSTAACYWMDMTTVFGVAMNNKMAELDHWLLKTVDFIHFSVAKFRLHYLWTFSRAAVVVLIMWSVLSWTILIWQVRVQKMTLVLMSGLTFKLFLLRLWNFWVVSWTMRTWMCMVFHKSLRVLNASIEACVHVCTWKELVDGTCKVNIPIGDAMRI